MGPHPENRNLIGQVVGNYAVRSLLGEGSMGTVYLAQHSFMGWRAAVKVLHQSLGADPVVVSRFLDEGRAAKSIAHPNVIEIIDVGVLENGLPYLLMELLEGETLGARLARQGRLPLQQALDIATQAAAGLAAAHDAGVIHRDLKPDNIFLVPDPDRTGLQKVKVLDFGIAKLQTSGTDSPEARTRQGVLLGTPSYMAPEQCRGIPVDHRADIYALAVILHQMLAGQPPFVGAGQGDLLLMHVQSPPPLLRTVNPDVPEFVESAVLRALAKSREQRFASMRDLAEALAGQPERTLSLPLPSAPPRLRDTRSIPVVRPQPQPVDPARRAAQALRRQVRNVVLGALVVVPLLIVIASDKAHPPPPEVNRRAPPPPSSGGVLINEPGISMDEERRLQAPAAQPFPRTPPASAEPPAAPRTAATARNRPPRKTPAAAAAMPDPAAPPPADDPPAPERRRSHREVETVSVRVLNPPAGLTVRVDGRPAALPLRLPRDGRSYRLDFQAPRFAPEARVVRANQDQALNLDNTPVIELN